MRFRGHNAKGTPLKTGGAPKEPQVPSTPVLPLWLKLAYTVFMAVLVPVYLSSYGPTNFLYFCDIALFLTLAALWTENALLAGMAAVGILVPQFFWCIDFGVRASGVTLTGMTDYMWDGNKPLFLRGLSLFHGWLPFLLVFLVYRLGYDRRALRAWTVIAWVAMLLSFFFMPRPGTAMKDPNIPVNINYVFGLNDNAAQVWMPEWAWLAIMLVGLPAVFYVPTHLALLRLHARRERQI